MGRTEKGCVALIQRFGLPSRECGEPRHGRSDYCKRHRSPGYCPNCGGDEFVTDGPCPACQPRARRSYCQDD